MNLIKLTAGIALSSAMSFAGPITLAFSSTGTGSIGATPLTDVAFTITATGDTANVVSCGAGCFVLDHSSASIDIAGVGIFSFVTATRTFAVSDIVGFGRSGTFGTDLLHSANNSALLGWGIDTSLGPITGVGTLLQWGGPAIVTSGGTLVFNDSSPTITFLPSAGAGPEPEPVPEPASLVMVFGGLALAILKRLRS